MSYHSKPHRTYSRRVAQWVEWETQKAYAGLVAPRTRATVTARIPEPGIPRNTHFWLNGYHYVVNPSRWSPLEQAWAYTLAEFDTGRAAPVSEAYLKQRFGALLGQPTPALPPLAEGSLAWICRNQRYEPLLIERIQRFESGTTLYHVMGAGRKLETLHADDLAWMIVGQPALRLPAGVAVDEESEDEDGYWEQVAEDDHVWRGDDPAYDRADYDRDDR